MYEIFTHFSLWTLIVASYSCLWLHVSDIGRGSQGGVCVCGWHGGNDSDEYPTWQLLAAIRCLSPEAQALTSFKTICLSFAANWFVLGWRRLGMLWGEYVFWQILCTKVCAIRKKKRAGSQLEDAFIASGWISCLCDALSCLNKAAGSLMGRHRSNFTPAIWFVFVRLQNALKSAVLDSTSRFLSVWSFTKPALFRLFKDSCQNLRKNKENYSKRKWPWLFSTALETATIIRSQMPEALEWICCVFWHHSMISFPPARRWRQ